MHQKPLNVFRFVSENGGHTSNSTETKEYMCTSPSRIRSTEFLEMQSEQKRDRASFLLYVYILIFFSRHLRQNVTSNDYL